MKADAKGSETRRLFLEYILVFRDSLDDKPERIEELNVEQDGHVSQTNDSDRRLMKQNSAH